MTRRDRPHFSRAYSISVCHPRSPKETFAGDWYKYKEGQKYTIKKLEIQKLGGRDPVTGRKVIQSMYYLVSADDNRNPSNMRAIPTLVPSIQRSAVVLSKSFGGWTTYASRRIGPRTRNSLRK